jgi:phage/plasmid-like protein (TIGR03299 family)
MNTATARRITNMFGKTLINTADATSVDQAMHIADLDFRVAKVDIHSTYLDPNGAGVIDFPSYAGIIRTDTLKPLSIMGSKYGVLQNDEVFAPLDILMREGIVESVPQAGYTNDGARVFMLARLSGGSKLDTFDPTLRNILIATTHDGSGATTARGWLERVACANQMPTMMGKKGSLMQIRHTANAADYLQGFRSAVVGAVRSIETFEQQIIELSQLRTYSADVDNFIKKMFPINPSLLNTREELLTRGEKTKVTRTIAGRDRLRNLIEEAPTNENVRGTKAALFHAAVEYSDYYSAGNRVERALYGRDVAFKAKALELAAL